MKELMRRIPLALIEKVDPTLFGLAALSFGPPRL
jgi:glucokinase